MILGGARIPEETNLGPDKYWYRDRGQLKGITTFQYYAWLWDKCVWWDCNVVGCTVHREGLTSSAHFFWWFSSSIRSALLIRLRFKSSSWVSSSTIAFTWCNVTNHNTPTKVILRMSQDHRLTDSPRILIISIGADFQTRKIIWIFLYIPVSLFHQTPG